MDELPFGGPEIANPLERIDVVVSMAIHFPLPGSPAEFMHLMKPKTGAAMHRVTATATVLLALALGGATTAEPLRTLAPGKLRVGTYFVNPLTAMRRGRQHESTQGEVGRVVSDG